jgi:mannose-6-phosphate isomerase-like protein (cupin superfamily)
MEILRSSDAIESQHAHTCTVFEYPVKAKDVTVARIWIKGSYPLTGVAVNHEVNIIVYVEEGNGTVTIDKKKHDIQAGNVIVIEKGEAACWAGEIVVIFFSAPKWQEEQHEIIPTED